VGAKRDTKPHYGCDDAVVAEPLSFGCWNSMKPRKESRDFAEAGSAEVQAYTGMHFTPALLPPLLRKSVFLTLVTGHP
jgi:hypothetical protein